MQKTYPVWHQKPMTLEKFAKINDNKTAILGFSPNQDDQITFIKNSDVPKAIANGDITPAMNLRLYDFEDFAPTIRLFDPNSRSSVLIYADNFKNVPLAFSVRTKTVGDQKIAYITYVSVDNLQAALEAHLHLDGITRNYDALVKYTDIDIPLNKKDISLEGQLYDIIYELNN